MANRQTKPGQTAKTGNQRVTKTVTKKSAKVRRDSPEFGEKIAKTWKIATVAEERRSRVVPKARKAGTKTWVEYSSVRDFYRKNGIPKGTHQAKRNELRRTGKTKVADFELELVNAPYVPPYAKFPGLDNI